MGKQRRTDCPDCGKKYSFELPSWENAGSAITCGNCRSVFNKLDNEVVVNA